MRSLFIIFTIAVVAMGCDGNKRTSNSSRGNVVGLRGGASYNNGTNVQPLNVSAAAATAGGTYVSGWIPVSGSTEDKIKVYLSNVINPSDTTQLGAIDPNTALRFSAYLDVSGNAINLAATQMYLQVSDDQVGQTGSDGRTVIPFTFIGKAVAQSFNSTTGTFEVEFVDTTTVKTNPDEVWLSGTYRNNGSSLVATGKIFFKNYSAVSADYTKFTGQFYELGSFSSSACALFICRN